MDLPTAVPCTELDAFLRDLTLLSHRYGFGIEGGTLYEMEDFEDFLFGYEADADSKLIRA